MIVAVTGHVEEEYVIKSYQAGMDKVFPKPFPIKEFGLLLKEMNFIKEIPDNCRQDELSEHNEWL